jgi:CD109 antigen
MSNKLIALSLVLIIMLLVPLLPACSQPAMATGYTAIIPAVLQASSQQKVSVNLFDGQNPASGIVNLVLFKGDQEITRGEANIKGNGDIPFNVPDVSEGNYTLQIKGGNFQNEATVAVQNNFLVFLETDKPIYKPGQTIHIRVMTLDPALKPVSEKVTLETLDAKGLKIFRQEATTDEFGLANLELPVSQEPNLGVWKITAITAKAKNQLDVRIEEYVLPKYEVKAELPKDWFLVSEPIKGKVKAEYSYGKPVAGEVEIKATKYVGTWQTYATLKLDIAGEAEFTVPAASYVAGVPAGGGNGNVKIEFVVKEKSTGYQEKTDVLLNVSQASQNIQIIPSGSTFKPGLPYSFLVVTKTPDNNMVDTQVNAKISYLDKDFKQINFEPKTLNTTKGKVVVEINPPADAVALTISCSSQSASANKTIEAVYSPSGNFIHLEQTSEGIPQVGENIKFWVYSSKEAVNFYYEVISHNSVVFSDYTSKSEIVFPTTPAMAPAAKLLVYQILPNAEVAADYLPFKVTAQYPQNVKLDLSDPEAKPGDSINIGIQTEGEAEVGLAAVDKSVYILAENRMNLQQVFDELEKLYMNPQAELHEVNIYQGIENRGAKEVFKNAGVIVLSSNDIPEGKSYKQAGARDGIGMLEMNAGGKNMVLPMAQAPMATVAPTTTAAPMQSQAAGAAGLAEVQRVRQFFPETWIWETVKTNAAGKASLKMVVPDSITTWMLRAVAISRNNGLGVAENQLKVFQPFFLSIDLPYSAIRGEEFPVKVAIYNYLNQPQIVQVQIQPEAWFDLLDKADASIEIKANDIGSAQFKIRPKLLGTKELKITARSPQSADAVIKTLIIEPEGVAKEITDNLSLSVGLLKELLASIPTQAVEDSGRAYVALTSSYLTQTIDGLDKLLQMPFGCGEQNMVVFAPDVYITKYLKQSGQLKPEIMAKAEKLMLTGYQRELTYRRNDGSFSAFGQNDKEGSLWLTAFVLKCFSEAKGLIYIDEDVLVKARSWIQSHQNADGSFDAVGFVHHQEMMGGLKGKTALTAYVAIALLQAGEQSSSLKAVSYLEKQLNQTDEPYNLALMSYAFELARSAEIGEAHDKLMKLAKEDENGMHWGSDDILPLDNTPVQPGLKMLVQGRPQTSNIEATAYAALALVKHGDNLNASRAAKWLVSKRNAYGGYGSTQDTVVALQSLTEYSSGARADVDLTVSIQTARNTKDIKINSGNYDILQIVEVPVNEKVTISVKGKGEAIGQMVRRYNLPEAQQTKEDILKVDVSYDASEVAVNDLVKVSVRVAFNPPTPVEAGMTVVDISVPTGFNAVKDTIEKMVAKQAKIKRYDISGRKVIFYIENMFSGDSLSFDFMVQAMYPVKAKGVVSQAYSYYKPEISAETLSQDISVVAK